MKRALFLLASPSHTRALEQSSVMAGIRQAFSRGILISPRVQEEADSKSEYVRVCYTEFAPPHSIFEDRTHCESAIPRKIEPNIN